MANKTNTGFILGITAVATLGGFLFGYDTGVISGSQLFFTEYFQFDEVQKGWAASSALFGCLVGALMAGALCNKYSRKYVLIAAGILFSISAWGSGIPESLDVLVVFRIVGGLGVGLASMAAPMYIAEIAPPRDRGRLVSYYQLAIVLGFFVVFLATYFIGGGDVSGLDAVAKAKLYEYNKTQGWRVMFWSELIPSLAFTILLFFVPHTPRWLVMKGRYENAKNVLKKVSENHVEQELEEIKQSLERNLNAETPNIFSGYLFKVLIIGMALSMFQQITGINAILYYAADIFHNALGMPKEDALSQQLWLGAVNLVFTFIAIYQVDRWGRKPLLIIGTIGMMVGISILGITLYIDQKGVVSLIGMLAFVGSFALSMGPVTWVMLSEIFPTRVKGMAMSIAVAVQWLFNGLLTLFFPIISKSDLNQQEMNGSLPYFLFAVLCLATILFVWRMVPETKGKTLEEMEEFWKKQDR